MRPYPGAGSDPEEGSTTVTFAVIAMALIFISLFLIGAGTVMASRAHLQAVADLAALSAADASPVSAAIAGAPVSGCSVAGDVADANQASLTFCEQRGLDVYVVVERPGITPAMPVMIRAKARAGPP